jgi:hypothetical protein
MAVVALLTMNSCISVITKMVIKIEPEPASVFTHPTLSKFIAQNPGAAVVVRDPNATLGGVSASGKTSELCGIMERALMKRGYNPRDRRLFENVVEKMSDIDYVKLGEQTRTDLIFEITNFSQEEYVVRDYEEYKDLYFDNLHFLRYKKDVVKQKQFKEPLTLYGYSIEIKVVLLQDNLIGGTYKYFWTPCSQRECPLFDEKITQSAIKILMEEEGMDEGEAMKAMEHLHSMNLNDFVSTIVIPSLFKDMGADVDADATE